MSLTRLLIKDFRNIESADLALSPGFNFLVGANGSGKTSVLEAIYTLGHGRAFRSLQIGRVIRHEQESFVLHGRLQGEARETSIGLTKDKLGDSKVRIDGTDGHKVAELALLMPMQLITPEGFTLLNGGPKYRRAFLDWGWEKTTAVKYRVKTWKPQPIIILTSLAAYRRGRLPLLARHR
jgi:DNA replication and repair protein RecF